MIWQGISGGQMKRLSIGVEIVSLPSLIFFDGALI
jgi:ABC-type multidrug transport system ATPase subunit